MAKKYVWLKLKEDFFQQRTIKKLRKIAGGDTYVIIYLKLQLLSLTDEGKLFYEGVEDTFAEEMALAIDEDVENIKVTLLFLEKNGLIQTLDADEFTLPEVINSIGTETAAAERMRKMREAKKLNNIEDKTEKCNSVTPLLQHVTNSYTEKEEEKEIDKDIKIEDQEVHPSDSSSIKFKNNFIKLKNIVIQSTGQEEFRINNLMQPAKYKGIDLNTLIDKIQSSDFLMGKTEKKPTINHFTVKSLLDRIMADGYMSNDPKKDNGEEEGWW